MARTNTKNALLTSKFKRVLTFTLAMLMVISILPISMVSVAAAESKYIAKGKLITNVRLENYKTQKAPITEYDKSGWVSQPRQFKLENVVWEEGYELDSEGDEKLNAVDVAYCIEHGATFKDKILRNYYGYLPEDSKYFEQLTETQKMGILLVTAFGYTGGEFTDYGADNPEQAIAATQALLWEFNVGTRVSFEDDARIGESPDWAFSMLQGDDKLGARNAYYYILASIRNWLEDGGDWTSLLSDPGMVIWEQSDKSV